MFRQNKQGRQTGGNGQHHHIVIVGCGRLGARLANQLSAAGNNIIVIDRRSSAFDKLSVDFSGYQVVGDVTELQVLQEAKIKQADFVFATTDDDNTNLMVAQIAREVFRVPRVIARVYDPEREAIYGDFGVETISPTKLTSDMFIQAIEGKAKGA